MKLFLIGILVLNIGVLAGSAQTNNVTERRVIEVSGSAEQWITPDTFTFKITVIERMDKKDKITIEQQETLLRSELSKIGLDAAKALTVYDINSVYFPQKKVRDVLSRKDYSLKLTDISKIGPLVELIDRLNIGRLSLEDTEHSEMERLRRETKIQAMKAAKEKAEYLLASIGERPGKPVHVKEIEQRGNISLDGVSSNSISSNISVVRGGTSEPDPDLSFAQIRIRFVIDAKFEIE